MMNQKIVKQIDLVIEVAMIVQAETGSDPDYRRMAQEELNIQRQRLIDMIEEQ